MAELHVNGYDWLVEAGDPPYEPRAWRLLSNNELLSKICVRVVQVGNNPDEFGHFTYGFEIGHLTKVRDEYPALSPESALRRAIDKLNILLLDAIDMMAYTENHYSFRQKLQQKGASK